MGGLDDDEPGQRIVVQADAALAGSDAAPEELDPVAITAGRPIIETEDGRKIGSDGQPDTGRVVRHPGIVPRRSRPDPRRPDHRAATR